MYEIRIHGRGGQGAVLASKILAKALVEEGRHAKSIPSFGFERRGAPVSAFLRFDDRPIRKVTNIYHPNCIICIDATLPRSVNIFEGLMPNGVLVQATKKELDRLELPEGLTRVGLCDAVGLALDIFGRPITNSIMLGSFARTTGLVSKEALAKGMESVAFRDANLELNITAIERGFEETRVHDLEGVAKA
jgi:pyruvate ferredoxin oxidoreductase gamma subunit/phenylglyoxylate dehydrogenase gamma subunit